MGLQLDTIARARALFRDAARRAVVPLTSGEVEDLSQKVLLALEAIPGATTKLKEISSQIVVRPSIGIARELAVRLRYYLNAGDAEPLFDLPSLLDKRLDVFLFPIEQNKLNSACAHIDDSAFIFIADSAGDETLFICAHQLGHLLTLSARRSGSDGAIIDPDNDETTLRGPYEHFADAFATELLIPNRGLGLSFQKVRKLLGVPGGPVGDIELLYLSRIFGVNFLSVAKKCERVGLLPRGGAIALYQFLVDKFGGPEHRARDLGLPPHTTVQLAPVPRSIDRAISEQIERGTARPGHAPEGPSRGRDTLMHTRPQGRL